MAKFNGEEKTYTEAEKDTRRRYKFFAYGYGLALVLFQMAIALVFALVVMKARRPNFRVRSAMFDNFQVSTLNVNASFNIRMNAQLGLKNKNFGEYKYENSTIEFFYKLDYKIGEAIVPKGKMNLRLTKKINVAVDLSSATVPGNELGDEFLMHAWIRIRSRSNLNGKVKLMLIMKKKKSTDLNCTMNINISSKQLQDLNCN